MPRLDQLLVARGLAPSRSRAADWIGRGLVMVNGRLATKAGADIAEKAEVAVAEGAARYVSRGAEKLIAALDRFGFEPAGRHAIDVGASTGGFTEVLLERGVCHVTAVDVGRDQLHVRLRSDPRVTVREATDARRLIAGDCSGPIGAIVADVSFIALEKALPAALALAEPDAWLVVLVKPQFEVGPAFVGKRGIVRDEAAREAAVVAVADWLERSGWRLRGSMPSPIAGGDGNREFLLGAIKAATKPT